MKFMHISMILLISLITSAQCQKTANDWFNEGFIESIHGNYDQAIQDYDEAIKLDPDFAEAWNNKGYALYELGLYNKSLQATNRSLELRPIAENWDTKGVALYRLGKYAEAVECYNKAIELNSGIDEIWYHKCDALKALGKSIEADAACANAKELRHSISMPIEENNMSIPLQSQEGIKKESWWQFWK